MPDHVECIAAFKLKHLTVRAYDSRALPRQTLMQQMLFVIQLVGKISSALSN